MADVVLSSASVGRDEGKLVDGREVGTAVGKLVGHFDRLVGTDELGADDEGICVRIDGREEEGRLEGQDEEGADEGFVVDGFMVIVGDDEEGTEEGNEEVGYSVGF